MSDQVDQSTQRAIELAHDQARALGHWWLGPEHLLLGLLADPHSPAGASLRNAGATLEASRQALQRLIPDGQRTVNAVTPNRPAAAAVAAATQPLTHSTVSDDSQLLLQAITTNSLGLVATVLAEQGVEFSHAR